jgi:hypothetical protein
MSHFKHLCSISQIAFLLVSTGAGLTSFTMQAQALENIHHTEISQLIFAAPSNPPDQGTPGGRRQGGANREFIKSIRYTMNLDFRAQN